MHWPEAPPGFQPSPPGHLHLVQCHPWDRIVCFFPSVYVDCTYLSPWAPVQVCHPDDYHCNVNKKFFEAHLYCSCCRGNNLTGHAVLKETMKWWNDLWPATSATAVLGWPRAASTAPIFFIEVALPLMLTKTNMSAFSLLFSLDPYIQVRHI